MRKQSWFLVLGLIVVVGSLIQVTNTVHASKAYNSVSEYKSIERSIDGIEQYKAKVKENLRRLEKEKVNNIAATITFEKPLSFEELQTYVKKHQITPRQIQCRALDGNDRLTIAVKQQKNMHEIVQKQIESATFIGYIDMYAILDSKQIPELETDPLTFLVDTSGDSYFTGSDKEFPHALSWLLEDLKYNKK